MRPLATSVVHIRQTAGWTVQYLDGPVETLVSCVTEGAVVERAGSGERFVQHVEMTTDRVLAFGYWLSYA